MIRKTTVVIALAVPLAALAATLLAGPSGAAHRKYTIAYFGYGYVNMPSARRAAKRLGVRVLFPNPRSPSEWVRTYESLIARHVDAIVTSGFDPRAKPTYRKVRKAGILLISSGDDIAGKRDLWVSQSDSVAYGQALADALASQIGKQGEYAILEQQDEYPIADTWGKVVENYIPRAYPRPPVPQRPDRHHADRGGHGRGSDHTGRQDRPGLLRRQR
jgi:ABC-type sugar transport system substrate-binding protein